MAAGLGHADVAKLLIEGGAAAGLRTQHGTAAEVAREQGHLELADFLEAQVESCLYLDAAVKLFFRALRGIRGSRGPPHCIQRATCHTAR